MNVREILEEWNKIEQRLEISERRVIIESDDEKIWISSKQEYAIVMSTLETWLKSSKQKQYGIKKKYLRKEINIPLEDNPEIEVVYMYTFKKITINHYIIINKVLADENNRQIHD